MKVSPISYQNTVSMKSNNSQKKTSKPFSPAKVGTAVGVGCFGAGLLFDRACAFLFNLTRDIKTSLIVNSVVGAGIGIYTYIQAKNAQKEEIA